MSVKPLLDQLRRDADAERERRLAGARARALQMSEEAQHQLQRERHDALAERGRLLRIELDRERAVVSRQCQLEELHARRQLIERCLTLAMARTDSLREAPGFLAALQQQLVRALSYLPDGACRMRCAAALEPSLRTACSGQSAHDVEISVDDAIGLGFVVESRDGRVKVDATVPRLIAQERDALAIAIVRRYQQHVP